MRDLVGRFHAVLGAGGYLVVGHAETLWQVTDAFTLLTLGDAFAYRKDAPGRAHARARAGARAVDATRRRRAELLGVRRTARVERRPAPPFRTLRPVLDTVPDVDHASDLLRLAREALEQTRYAEAARLAAAAAAASPFEVDAYVVEGRARATVGDDAGALVALRKAVYLAPKAGHARFQLAGALSRCGEHAGAAREYRAAAAALPQTPESELARPARRLRRRAAGHAVPPARRRVRPSRRRGAVMTRQPVHRAPHRRGAAASRRSALRQPRRGRT